MTGARDFALAVHAVRGCDSCVSATTMPGGPRVPQAPRAGTRVEVVALWDQPDYASPKVHAAGVSSERLMRTLLREGGIDADRVMFLPVAACHGGKIEVQNCRRHLERTLNSLPKLHVVMLCGGAAVNAWRKDVTISKSRGVTGVMLDKWVVFVTNNPANVVLSFRGKRELKDELRNDIQVVKGIVDGLINPEFEGMYHCNIGKCTYDAARWDRDGVGYCDKHIKDHGGRWRKERKQWDTWKMIALQPKLAL